jgi:hypothetical protein
VARPCAIADPPGKTIASAAIPRQNTEGILYLCMSTSPQIRVCFDCLFRLRRG